MRTAPLTLCRSTDHVACMLSIDTRARMLECLNVCALFKLVWLDWSIVYNQGRYALDVIPLYNWMIRSLVRIY